MDGVGTIPIHRYGCVGVFQLGILSHQAKILCWRPDKRREIPILRAAYDRPAVEGEIIIAQVQLHRAKPATADGFAGLDGAKHGEPKYM